MAVYLGKRVEDRGIRGLSSIREFHEIIEAIVSDYHNGLISKKKAHGRLLLLYRLTFKKNNKNIRHLSRKSLQRVRDEIKEAMSSL